MIDEAWIMRTSVAIDPKQADDLAQEARILAWGYYGDYHPNAAKPYIRSRLWDLAAGKTGWTGQDRPRRYDRPTEVAADWDHDLAEHLASAELLERIELAYHYGEIYAALDRLTPNERRLIRARYWEGKTWTEVEREWGYAPNPVWRSARDKLRKDLAHLRGAA